MVNPPSFAYEWNSSPSLTSEGKLNAILPFEAVLQLALHYNEGCSEFIGAWLLFDDTPLSLRVNPLLVRLDVEAPVLFEVAAQVGSA